MLKPDTFKYSFVNKSWVIKAAVYVCTKKLFRELQTLIESKEFKFHLYQNLDSEASLKFLIINLSIYEGTKYD